MTNYYLTGYVGLQRLSRGMTPRHFSAWREFSLWGLTIHFAGLQFQVIGPFAIKRRPAPARGWL